MSSSARWWMVLVAIVVAASCSSQIEVSTGDAATATPDTTVEPTGDATGEPTDEPTATELPTDEPTEEPTATPEPPGTPDPTATSEPTATPTDEPEPPGLVVEVGAGPRLFDVDVATPAEAAIERFVELLGSPTSDSGWVIGCPLDSETEPNERVVTWGSLETYFRRDDGGGNERFELWGYALDPNDLTARPGGPPPGQVVLPNGAFIGQPIADASQLIGIPVTNDVVFGWDAIIDPAAPYNLIAFTNLPGNPIDQAWVPFPALCE